MADKVVILLCCIPFDAFVTQKAALSRKLEANLVILARIFHARQANKTSFPEYEIQKHTVPSLLEWSTSLADNQVTLFGCISLELFVTKEAAEEPEIWRPNHRAGNRTYMHTTNRIRFQEYEIQQHTVPALRDRGF